MNEEQLAQLNALFKDTIYPALCEDFNFVAPSQVKDAISTLMAKLASVDVNAIVPMDLED